MEARQLPVYQQRERILSILKDNQVIVVESPTGSGKTTQLPIILHEAGFDRSAVIGITQPRRIAAVGVSAYIQQQLFAEQGDAAAGYVAYKMRFIDNTSPQTRIKIMTDGILLQEIKADPLLSRYSVIMVDEAHERSLNIDFILGLLKRSLESRPELKVIISSATINAEIFSEYFNKAPIVRIETRTFPISMTYMPPRVPRDPDSLIEKIVEIVGRRFDARSESQPDGGILIFLSGEKLIKDCIRALQTQPFHRKLYIIPLYARLSKEEQDEVFPPAPKGRTKVVVATNIAETSITIDGIQTIIDPGLAKINFYNPRSYTSSLVEQAISRAAANQRRGRAGRTGPGNCYRLYSREDFEHRPLFKQEEIYRTDLSEVVLRMAELDIRDFESFDFISSPGQAGIASAIETLMLLNALTPDRSLSEIGQHMSRFPLLPRHSRIIVEAMLIYPDVLNEVLITVSFLSTASPFLLPQGEEMEARNAHHHFRDDAGDFVSYLKIFHAFQTAKKKDDFCKSYYLDPQALAEIVNVKQQLSDIVEEMGIHLLERDGDDVVIPRGERLAAFICAIARGLIQFICVRRGRSSYRSLTAERIDIHPGSVMFRETPLFLVAGEIVKTTRTFARSVSPLKREWLPRISPDLAALLEEEPERKRHGKGGKRDKGGKGDKRGKGGKRDRQDRDRRESGQKTSSAPPVKVNSQQVILGGRVYTPQPWKGKKKILELSWQELSELSQMKHLDLIPQYQHLRIRIRYQDKIFLRQEQLARALKIARFVNPGNDLHSNWRRDTPFNIWEASAALNKSLEAVLKLTVMKKSGKGPREIGFITLCSAGPGLYNLRAVRNFNNSLTESIASLESLADEINILKEHEGSAGADQTVARTLPALRETTNSLYRRLSRMLEDV